MKRTPLRRHRRTKSLRAKLFPEFARLIKRRDGRCLKGGDCGGPLQAAHLYPRGSWPLLVLFPRNCITLCYRHHLHWWHKSSLEAWAWYRQSFPQAWRDQLEAMRVQHLTRKRMDEAAIRAEWAAYGLGGEP